MMIKATGGQRRKDRKYARTCVAMLEDLHAKRITAGEYERRLAALDCWKNKGTVKPEKSQPPRLFHDHEVQPDE